MNKTELITKLSEATTFTKKDTDIFVKAFTELVEETLAKGEKISMVGFGTFETTTRSARVGRNPKTKEEINIPETIAPVFKFAKTVKDKFKTK